MAKWVYIYLRHQKQIEKKNLYPVNIPWRNQPCISMYLLFFRKCGSGVCCAECHGFLAKKQTKRGCCWPARHFFVLAWFSNVPYRQGAKSVKQLYADMAAKRSKKVSNFDDWKTIEKVDLSYIPGRFICMCMCMHVCMWARPIGLCACMHVSASYWLMCVGVAYYLQEERREKKMHVRLLCECGNKRKKKIVNVRVRMTGHLRMSLEIWTCLSVPR